MKQTEEQGEKVYPRRPDHVVWKVIEGKGILLNLENGAYFETDPVGLAIWGKCNGTVAREAIAQSIAEEFRTDQKRVTRDLLNFLSELKRRKLLEISERPRAAVAPS